MPLDPASLSAAQDAFACHLTDLFPGLVIGVGLTKVGGDPFGMYHAQVAFNPEDPIDNRPAESAVYAALRSFLHTRKDLTLYLDAVYYARSYDMPPKREAA